MEYIIIQKESITIIPLWSWPQSTPDQFEISVFILVVFSFQQVHSKRDRTCWNSIPFTFKTVSFNQVGSISIIGLIPFLVVSFHFDWSDSIIKWSDSISIGLIPFQLVRFHFNWFDSISIGPIPFSSWSHLDSSTAGAAARPECVVCCRSLFKSSKAFQN